MIQGGGLSSNKHVLGIHHVPSTVPTSMDILLETGCSCHQGAHSVVGSGDGGLGIKDKKYGHS